MSRTPKNIINAVHSAGVVGAGGGGFPTHVKLAAKVDIILANGSECEPLLATDKTLIKNRADLIIDGIKVSMEATGAKEGIIAVKGYYKDVVKALNKALEGEENIRIHLLDNYYPAGDEFFTVYDATKRIIPEGGIPLNVGVVVSNVLSLAQIAHAVNGKPVTERILTIAGEVENPMVLTVPIGTTYSDIIKMAGGLKDSDVTVIDGGPMMGNIVTDLDAGIAKTTSGILVLPTDNFVIRMKTKTLSQMIKLSKAACCQCNRCTDLCTRYLLGHEIYPHKTMRTIDYNISEPTEHITSAFLCSQCGMCEMVSCDFMLLSPKQIYAEYRKKLVAAGVKNPHTRSGFEVHSQLEHRKVSIPTLLKKMGLTKYYRTDLPDTGMQSVDRVRIPYKRHIGAPAIPEVSMGQEVRMGDIIAATPAESLGTFYHASIAGKVTEISDDWIEISK